MEIIELPEEITDIADKYSGFIEVGGGQYAVKQLHEGIPNYDYQRSVGIGSTSLKAYVPESPCPENYRAYKAGEIEFNAGEATRIGTTWHGLNLTPLSWQDEIQIMPKFPYGKKTSGEAELRAAHPEITFVSEEEFETASNMRDVLARHPEVQALFQQIMDMRTGTPAGQMEVSGWYNDLHPLTGEGTFMLCKYRPDMRFCPEWTPHTWIADLKSTEDASPEEFMRSINKWGYHISAAHYLEGDYIIHNRKPRQFIFIAQERKPPYLVAVYVLGERTLKYGEYLRRIALNGIYDCKKAQQWPHYAYNKATIIDLPNYITSRMER